MPTCGYPQLYTGTTLYRNSHAPIVAAIQHLVVTIPYCMIPCYMSDIYKHTHTHTPHATLGHNTRHIRTRSAETHLDSAHRQCPPCIRSEARMKVSAFFRDTGIQSHFVRRSLNCILCLTSQLTSPQLRGRLLHNTLLGALLQLCMPALFFAPPNRALDARLVAVLAGWTKPVASLVYRMPGPCLAARTPLRKKTGVPIHIGPIVRLARQSRSIFASPSVPATRVRSQTYTRT